MASGWKRAGNRRPAAVSSPPAEFEQIIQEARREATQAEQFPTEQERASLQSGS
jgi:hypothetical protein